MSENVKTKINDFLYTKYKNQCAINVDNFIKNIKIFSYSKLSKKQKEYIKETIFLFLLSHFDIWNKAFSLINVIKNEDIVNQKLSESIIPSYETLEICLSKLMDFSDDDIDEIIPILKKIENETFSKWFKWFNEITIEHKDELDEYIKKEEMSKKS